MFTTPQLLSKEIGSFINGDGGILCFGVRKTGVIYGDSISRKEEDLIRLLIDETFKKMHPHVATNGYRVTFTPVLKSSHSRCDGGKDTRKLHVLEVRIAPGDPFSLYEDLNHEVSCGWSWHGAVAMVCVDTVYARLVFLCAVPLYTWFTT